MSKKSITILSQDPTVVHLMEKILGDGYSIVFFNTIRNAFDHICHFLPNLIVIDTVLCDIDTVSVINDLKADPIFGRMPVLVLVDDGDAPGQWGILAVDDFMRKADMQRDLDARVDLSITRTERVAEVNPLTRLPGNISINLQIQKRIDAGEFFSLGYADLDHFKPFNDYYGFSRGDEIIKMTGRLILNIVNTMQPHGSFVGHIGGDDFIYIMDVDLVESASQEIVENFDRIVPIFYDEKEREQGFISSIDRQGVPRDFPIIALSIGITSNRTRKFLHYGQMTEAVSEMKHFAKQSTASSYRIDKRRDEDPVGSEQSADEGK
jgi:diguanylate cyclase (GGDEF)-like protein